jgi:hypothetical protein
MKQFQKVGLAAAVATVAAGTVASDVSRTETGDLAIIPYYTVLDGTNTGMHIINTTDSTQVVKVRLRRGTDSKDALDFNLVMSPYDEWTANIGAGGANGVLVTTNDTTCTVPEFPEGGAPMPDTFSEGATEGYVEIIAMAQTTDETQPIAVGAKHKDGVPADCSAVRQNFYRVAATDVGDGTVRGTHTSGLTSNAVCETAAATGACKSGAAANLSFYADSDDNALKVSFMLTDPAGGLEAGDNAVMIQGFSEAPMMTNQQPLSFGTDGLLNFDPLNFELPNLAYGAFESTVTARAVTASMTDGSMWNDLADALDADSIMNDWAAFSTSDGTVHADWVVTLPGQYVMTNPVCDTYESYSQATITAIAVCNGAAAQTTAGIAAGLDVLEATYSAAGGDDRNQLPLIVASNVDGGVLIGDGAVANMNLWDREELLLAGNESEKPPEDPDLGFSPGGSSGDPDDPDVTVVLPYEVNVIAFGDADTSTAVMSDLKLSVTPPATSDRGWGRLDIQSSNDAPEIWSLSGTDDGNVDAVADGLPLAGAFSAVADPTDVAVVGFAIWQRSFAAQAGNYGRMIEHSTIASTTSSRY